MLAKLDTTWLIIAVAAVAMLSYIFSIGLNALLRDGGFGTVGSAAILTFGFFGSIHAANLYGTRFPTLLEATLAGVAGAFVLYLALVLVKLALNRLV